MIAHYRHRAGQREPIAAPGDAASLSAVYAATPQTWGKITSKRPAPLSSADLSLMAFRTGVKPAILRRAIELGLFK